MAPLMANGGPPGHDGKTGAPWHSIALAHAPIAQELARMLAKGF